MVGKRRIGTGLLAVGLTFAPAVTTAARVHAQFSDAEGADGGDVSGGDGGAGSAGVMPNGNQNNAALADTACFSDDGCGSAFDDAAEWFGGTDPFETDAFADDA